MCGGFDLKGGGLWCGARSLGMLFLLREMCGGWIGGG